MNECSYVVPELRTAPCVHIDRMQEFPGMILPEDCTVDLNSEVPLLYPWQQFLNIQTGEIYYVNKNDGSKTDQDPRRHSFVSGIYEEADGKRRSGSSSSIGSNGSCFSSTPAASTASSSSTISTASSTARSSTHRRRRRRDNNVLVLVGCKVCLTLSMVSRPGMVCAKCGSVVVRHF